MALVRFAEGQQRSGSVGGTVFSHNRFGQYLRARSIPVNPNSDRQVDVRNEVRALSIAWAQTLTQNQRDAWDVYASNISWVNKLGDPVNLTGQNHYIRSNSSRAQVGLLRLDDPPIPFNLAPAELSLVASGTASTQNIDIAFDDTADWLDQSGGYQAVYMGTPVNPSRKFFGGPYRFAGVILGDDTTAPTTPQTIAAPFSFAEDQRIWIRTRVGLEDGRLSEFAQVNFLGVA